MAIFKYLFDNEFSQRSDIERLASRTRGLEVVGEEVAHLQAQVAALEADLGRSVLLLRGLSSLMIEKGLFSEAELRETVLRIDREDGVEDGRASMHEAGRPDVFCPNCGRRHVISGRGCVYCG